MILVDTRAGSKDLIKPLRDLGLDVQEDTLEYGDLAFRGRGEGGKPLLIGIEHKKLSDLVQSLEGRLPGHQLPGMVQMYDRCWLIVEGDWAADTDGKVTMFKAKGTRRRVKGSPPAVDLEKRLLTLEVRGGLHIVRCPKRADSIRWIFAAYRFWTDKDLDGHKSHLAIFAPDLDRNLLIPMSDFRRIVAQIPGIGLRTSKAVEEKFGGSFHKMMLATETTWAEITTIDDHGKTRRIGTPRARTIMEALK